MLLRLGRACESTNRLTKVGNSRSGTLSTQLFYLLDKLGPRGLEFLLLFALHFPLHLPVALFFLRRKDLLTYSRNHRIELRYKAIVCCLFALRVEIGRA